MSEHKHEAKALRYLPFTGPVAGANYNPAAHGNVCIVSTCVCGAECRQNVNGLHTEKGPWIGPHKESNND